MGAPHVVARFKDFQNSVLLADNLQAAGIDKSLFQIPERLHMTVLMLKLYSERDRKLACEVLDSLATTCKEIIGSKTIQVCIPLLRNMSCWKNQNRIIEFGMMPWLETQLFEVQTLGYHICQKMHGF